MENSMIPISHIRLNQRIIIFGKMVTLVNVTYIKKGKLFENINGRTFKYSLYNELTREIDEIFSNDKDNLMVFKMDGI